jgi:hypothetical protein
MDAGVDAGMDAGIDAGCVPTGAVDLPDPLGLDVDCDGFDGDLSRAVFVDPLGGNDGNAGTRTAPLQSLLAATSTGREQVYLATGTLTGNLTLPNAVSLFGGYDASSWARTTTKTVINGALIAQPGDGGVVRFERLDVRAGQPSTASAASVALTLRGVGAGSAISECRLQGGQGADGLPGANAPVVANGRPGHAGLAGVDADGGVGGEPVDCGDAGFTLAGFPGGAGATTNSGLGADGLDVLLGGLGGGATYCDGGPCVGHDGGAGTDALAGTASMTRPADPPATAGLGTVSGGQWTGVTLSTWTPALPGEPGGGGGGGGGLLDLLDVLLGRGGGGGGGGSGGCGARSGGAGRPGGASIALLLIDASPTLRDVQLVTTQGGDGGNGGTAGMPGSGGPGGTGGAGQIITTEVAGSGGRGGQGGAGGPGRQGPGGWGGPVIGLFCSGTSAPVTDATTTWSAGSPGLAGSGDPNGRAGGQPSSGYSVGCP